MTSKIAVFYEYMMKKHNFVSRSLFDDEMAFVEDELFDRLPWANGLPTDQKNELIEFAFERRQCE